VPHPSAELQDEAGIRQSCPFRLYIRASGWGHELACGPSLLPSAGTISIVSAKPRPPLQGITARRIVRVCSAGKRGQQEIADALGMTSGGIQYALTALLNAGALNCDSASPLDASRKPKRGNLYWADEEQLAAAELAARAGHDSGRLLEGDLVLIVRGADVAMLHEAMRPTLTAVATRWAVRLLGNDGLWLLAIGGDRDVLLVDQLVAAVREAGGRVESFSAEKLLDGTALRAYLDAASSPPAPARA
jgi:hypothetical protein